jgi:hypothetical protein
MRNKKLSLHDVLYYQFSYSSIHKTKQEIVSNFNFENKNFTVNKTSMYKKEKNIPLNFYKQLFIKIKELYDNEYNNFNKIDKIINKNYINLEKYNIYAVDGTNNNTTENQKLVSNLNMCIYDCNGMIPIDIFSYGKNKFANNKNNISDKNSEVFNFMKYIEENKIKNSIFVCDRAYFKYELFDLLEEKKLKYVIRIKENSNIINNTFMPTKNDKNYKYIIKLKNNPSVKIVKYEIKTEKQLKSKTNETKNIIITNKYYLITNLGDNNISDEEIKNIYNSRWNIETYFKLLKSKFKFSYLIEKDKVQHEKLKIISMIIVYIAKILIYYGLSKNEKFKNAKINISNMISGIYKKILKIVIYGKLNENIVEKFINSYVTLYKNQDGRNFVRKSLLPFSKWYVKMFHCISKYAKIINSIENNTTEKLNKNFKSISKNIKLDNT